MTDSKRLASFASIKKSSEPRTLSGLSSLTGPSLVALGASLWATDSLFRAPVIHHYSALFIVAINHCLLFIPSLLILFKHRDQLRRLTRTEWLALLYVACMVSVVGTIAFTEAFANTSNYSVPVLIQKIQPCFAIILGHFILNESVKPRFWSLALIALLGTYLLSFGFQPAWTGIERTNFRSIAYAFLAAMIWGSGTVVGRLLLKNISFSVVTAARFLFGTIFALILVCLSQQLSSVDLSPSAFIEKDVWNFLCMAFVSGMLPIWIYYRGLRSTPVPIAALCELTFPIVAILLNWIYLGAALNAGQLLGASLILIAISAISLFL